MNKLINLLHKNPALSWVLGFQLFRLTLLPFMGLMPQDAYYYLYGQHLDWSYFDHPGMIGYCLRLFSELFGTSVFIVKMTDFTLTSLTIYFFYQLSTYFLSKKHVQRAIILFTSTIFISILSFNSTPDVPLLLFWTLSVLTLYKAIFEGEKSFWIIGGVFVGLSFLSKYTALLLPIGLFGFLAFSKTYRKLLQTPWPYISLFIMVVVSSPVWWWNMQHEFASFAFQSSSRAENITKFELKPKLFFGAIGHQMALLIPVLFIVFVSFTYKYLKKVIVKLQLPSAKVLFLLAFFIPTFVGFFALTPVYWVKLNWMMPSYITGIILAGMYITQRGIKLQLIFSVVLHIIISFQLIYYIVPIKSDDTWVGWEELSEATILLQKQYPNTFVFSDDNYKTSAALNFFMDDTVYAQNIIGLQALQFDYLGDDLNALKGKNALFIDSDKRMKSTALQEHPNELLQQYFSTITQLKPIIIYKDSKMVRKFWVYYCENYHPKP